MNRRTLRTNYLKKTIMAISVLLFAFFVSCSNVEQVPRSNELTKAVDTWETKSLGGFNSVLVYTPSATSPIGASGKHSLLIVLHGCAQSYIAYKNANLEDVADQYGMVIAVPDAKYKAGFQCWDYWGTIKSRTAKDYANVINLAKYFTENTDVDPAQVYVSGLSSGGAFAMTAACLAPDIFAGMGIMAGPSTGTNSLGAFSHQSTVSQTASRCESYAGSYSSYFDTQITVTAAGTSDSTVPQSYAPQNAGAMAVIYGAGSGVEATTSYGKEKLWSLSGSDVIAQLTLTGVPHAWPGGSGASGSYINGSSINFGLYLAEFFNNNNRRINRDSIAPVVSITSPVSGTTVQGTVSITATASDQEGSVTKVEFYINGTLKSTDSTAPYSYSWDAGSVYNGIYSITAKAYDEAGNTADSAVSVNVTGGATDTQPPTVNVTSPTNGATVNGILVLAASASDVGTGVLKVEFYINGSKVGEDTTNPYEINWDTSAVTDGNYSISAKAIDGANNEALDNDTTITVQQFIEQEFTDTNYNHEAAGRAYVSGLVSYYAVGSEDSLGLMGQTTTLCLTAPNHYELGACSVPEDSVNPSVNLTTPANGSTLSGSVTLSADASDNIGVSKVEFYAGSSKIGEDTTSPYSISFDTTTIANGSYMIKAKAYDAAGNSAEDADTSVSIDNQIGNDTIVPTVNVTSPTNGAALSGSVTLSADASDNVGVSKVEFYVGSSKIGEDTTSPYSISFDTTAIANGTYVIKAKAYDAAGNNAEDADTTITVQQFIEQEFTDTNYNHEAAGRAYVSGLVSYYAVGSEDSLGLMAQTTTLCETSPGHFELGACSGNTQPLNCYTDTNMNHNTAGRTDRISSTDYRAKGSGDSLGWGVTTTSLQETSPGYFEKVNSCS